MGSAGPAEVTWQHRDLAVITGRSETGYIVSESAGPPRIAGTVEPGRVANGVCRRIWWECRDR